MSNNNSRRNVAIATVQKEAPLFTAPGVVEGEIKNNISLFDYRGQYVVLFFYPMDFTFVCPTEIIAFNEAIDEFKSLNCELLAISCDTEYSHHAWVHQPRIEGGLGEKTRITLLSDRTKRISKEYGVYIEDQGISLRGLFIIDAEGIIRQITINDIPVGRSVDETIRLVEAFQYTDKHGEVCPVNWRKGDNTIIPDPEAAKKYFQNDD